jgi:hypothetical protein
MLGVHADVAPEGPPVDPFVIVGVAALLLFAVVGIVFFMVTRGRR